MRRLALAAGSAVLATVWLGPFLTEWRGSFASGMVAHMAVVAIASPLIAVGLPDRLRPGPGMPAALPVLASLFELLVVWGWHAPAARELVESWSAITVLEQTSFLAAGLLLWSTSFAGRERIHAATGAGALLLTSIHMTLLGALLALSPRPLYGAGEITCFGVVLDAGQDQQLGGVIMLAVGAVVYLLGGLRLAGRLLSHEGKPAAT
ncbi:cytochrome c oxidase assembly protein [Mesorhizobium australicum]|uniref:Cytochrome c oxidase assembly factor CtaG n=1 Tax=Mesorhizobium australicum TaxID=536018 RepID=A0A1X7N0X2_9HYPH|nr:cytochrome c oxidase assembly protein [Mesorhizobium australicum]SMH29995.1 Cytochrome c oxidase assembly factor CtaG [Mesorhizobium australicum]